VRHRFPCFISKTVVTLSKSKMKLVWNICRWLGCLYMKFLSLSRAPITERSMRESLEKRRGSPWHRRICDKSGRKLNREWQICVKIHRSLSEFHFFMCIDWGALLLSQKKFKREKVNPILT
jgi:hypothetical protein